MNYPIIWSPESKTTFEKIIQYLEENWSQKEIRSFIDRVDEVLHLISKHPKPFVYLQKYKAYRCVVVKQVSFFYRIKENQIELLTFWGNRMALEKLKL